MGRFRPYGKMGQILTLNVMARRGIGLRRSLRERERAMDDTLPGHIRAVFTLRSEMLLENRYLRELERGLHSPHHCRRHHKDRVKAMVHRATLMGLLPPPPARLALPPSSGPEPKRPKTAEAKAKARARRGDAKKMVNSSWTVVVELLVVAVCRSNDDRGVSPHGGGQAE